MSTILLVNDSATLTKVLASHFTSAGYRVIAVSSVFDAYEAYIRNKIDLILTDYVLQSRGGVDVIETFRAREPQVSLPIVVFTAMADEETTRKCLKAGANLVLSKSDGAEQLLEKIEELVDDYRISAPGRALDQDMSRSIVKATSEVFRKMLNMKVVPGDVYVERAQTRFAEVIGSIGVAGFLSGSISLFLPRTLVTQAVAEMLMIEPDDLESSDVIDGVGELTNMVAGNIKTELFQRVPLFDISVPSVYIGEGLQRRTVSDDLCFLVPFTIGDEEFSVEFVLVTKKGGGNSVLSSVVSSMANT